jgi:hypothetical protein
MQSLQDIMARIIDAVLLSVLHRQGVARTSHGYLREYLRTGCSRRGGTGHRPHAFRAGCSHRAEERNLTYVLRKVPVVMLGSIAHMQPERLKHASRGALQCSLKYASSTADVTTGHNGKDVASFDC